MAGAEGVEEGEDEEGRQDHQEEGVEVLADQGGDLALVDRCQVNEEEEEGRVDQQAPALEVGRQEATDADGEGDGRRPRGDEEGADQQLDQDHQGHPRPVAQRPGEVVEAVAAGKPQRQQGEQGQQDPREQEAAGGRQPVAAGQLAEVDGKDQVPRAEDHPKKEGSHHEVVFET